MTPAEGRLWLEQASSDFRVAETLLSPTSLLTHRDAGCHTAALCAQTLEKSLKGYLFLNGMTPKLDHRPDKYLSTLLTKNKPLLKYPGHHKHLSALFDQATKGVVKELFDPHSRRSGESGRPPQHRVSLEARRFDMEPHAGSRSSVR